MVNLTDDQVDKIQEWAAQTRYVKEVRLFGSRAKGSARPDSDIDLAITVGGSDDGVVRGNYFAVGPEWQRQLSDLLGLNAHVGCYNDPDTDVVRRSCDECSLILFQRHASP